MATLESLRAALAAQSCPAHEVLELSGRWYAACGVQGVLVFTAGADGFSVLERRSGLGEVRALFVRSGLVWVELQRTDALPLSHLPPQLVGAPGTAPPVASATSSAEPPRHDDAPESDRAIAPRRVANFLALAGGIKPILPIRKLAFAALGQVSLTYRGERSWYAQAQLTPLGGLVGKGRNNGLFGAFVGAGYDHWLFSVGLGLGALEHGTVDYDYDSNSGPLRLEEGVDFAVTQSARLGALDGLSLSVTNAFVLAGERWRHAFFDVALQIPIGRRTWLAVNAAGGEPASYWSGELALRRLLRGDRGSDSLFVSPSVGMVAIDTNDDLVAGPMVGVHLEWRK